MNFEGILADIDRLIGKELASINPKTGVITIIEIDHDRGSYSIKPEKGRALKRSFSELQKIWDQLCAQRAVNVEVVLEGAGSSRHHPETILANLPYVDYFKFQKKKHLYLQDIPTHELGDTNELSGAQLREAKQVLGNQSKFDRPSFSRQFKASLLSLTTSLEEVSIKYPSEFQSSELGQAIKNLDGLQKIIEGTVIGSDDLLSSFDIPNMGDLNSPEHTGFDDGHVDENEDETENNERSDSKEKELSAARVRYVTPTFSNVFDRMVHNEIELQPDFQRRDRIWSLKDKSSLVESILIGLPIPNLYFAEKSNGDWIVIDGLQRLTTLKDYMQKKFALSKLSVLKNLEGVLFDKLSRYHQRKFREYTLHSHIISMKKNDDTMVRELFQRINTNGLRLSYQEIRCSLYGGNSVLFIRYIAENDQFKKATFNRISSSRMKDMELVLGAAAFILYGYAGYKYNRFDSFLGEAMRALNIFKIQITGDFLTSQNVDEDKGAPPRWINEGTADIYIELKEKIEAAFSLAEIIFGSERYQKSIKGRTVISKPLFELIIATFANLTQAQAETLVAKRDIVKSEFQNLMNGKGRISHAWESETYINEKRDFMYSISQSTGKRVTVLYRFQNFQSLIEGIIGTPIQMNGLLEKYANWEVDTEQWTIKEKYADQYTT